MDFLKFLIEIQKGQCASMCGDQMAQLVRAVRETGKGGEFVLKIAVKPTKMSLHEGVTETAIKYAVDIKEPQPETGATIFFPLENGALVRDDPSQLAMEFQPKE